MRRQRRPLRTLVVLLVLLGALSVREAQVEAQRSHQPARRSYGTHAYYVLELGSGSSEADAASIAGQLGAELVEQVGELRDHWLLRADHLELLARRSKVVDDENNESDDDVLRRYRAIFQSQKQAMSDWRLPATGKHRDLLSSLTSRSSSVHPRIVSLDKQVVKKRVKRQLLPVKPPGTLNGQAQEDNSVSAYLSDLAERFSILDPLWPKQWHLANDQMRDNSINVTGVWDQGVTGKGVRVAIVDDGLDMHSNDLVSNFYADGSWDYNDHTDLPEPRLSDDQHGTRCAGEIAAAKNDVCGVGVAYNAQVSGIRILSAAISDADEASALNFGYQENDIYSCSWGPPDDGRSMEAPSKLIYKSMINGVQNGRGGKGSVFVFASGNGGAVDDQCNFDGYTNSIYSITISAIDRKGLHPYYSEGCSANMVVTFSSGSGDNIHTTDVGENKCTHHHGGTSAAAPIAAGIYALVLEVRPELTWRDMQHLSVETAVQVNVNDPDWQTTHAGRPYNHKYGYGKIDAYAIVERAKTWELVKPQAWYEAPKMKVGKRIIKEGISSSFEITADNLDLANFEKLEHITVTVNAEHDRRGNMEVILESPNGVKSILARPRRFDHDANGFPDWTFMSVKHWGENPVGNWTLTMLDRQNNGKNGTFVDWSMSFWGSAIDAAIAEPYKMQGDEQIVLPEPPHHKVVPNVTTQTFTSGGKVYTETSTIIADHSKTTKKFNKPTAHLPGDHAEQTGESDHPLDGLPTATPAPSSPAGGSEELDADENTGDELEYLGPWSSLRDSQNWFYVAAGSVIIFLGAAGAYFLYRRQQQRALGRSAGWLGGYSTLSGRDEDGGLPMSALERGRMLFTGRSRASANQQAYAPGRTRQLYDAFALSDSEDEEAIAALDRQEAGRRSSADMRDRKVDDSYMSSFLADDEELRSPGPGGGPRHSTPSPEPGAAQQRYRDDDLDEEEEESR